MERHKLKIGDLPVDLARGVINDETKLDWTQDSHGNVKHEQDNYEKSALRRSYEYRVTMIQGLREIAGHKDLRDYPRIEELKKLARHLEVVPLGNQNEWEHILKRDLKNIKAKFKQSGPTELLARIERLESPVTLEVGEAGKAKVERGRRGGGNKAAVVGAAVLAGAGLIYEASPSHAEESAVEQSPASATAELSLP